MPKAIKVTNCVVEEDICEDMSGLKISKPRAPIVPKDDRRFQAGILWAEAQSPLSTPETRAALEATLCIFDTVQKQNDFLAKFNANVELALIEEEQKERAKAAAPPTPSPAKGEAAKKRAARVSMTPATLDGRPAFVDEQGCYYEAVAIARAL
jgi:hypothetical protein